MSKVEDIISAIEEFAPLYLQEEYDNSGLLIGDRERSIKKALITLDVTNDVIEEAISKGIDIIISHHPIIFSPIKNIITDDINGLLITKAIRNGMAIYSAHTNVDNAPESIAKEFADKLFCNNIVALDFTSGVTAELKEAVRMRDLISIVRDILKDNNIKSIGNLEDTVRNIIFANGANGGNEELVLYASRAADVLITAEVKHHIALLAKQRGLKVIECGHYESERLFIELIYRKLNNCISDVDFVFSETNISPYN